MEQDNATYNWNIWRCQEKIVIQLKKEREIARDLLKNEKIVDLMILILLVYRKAKLLLKKKREFEQKLEKINGQLYNIDHSEYIKIENIINDNKEFGECQKVWFYNF